MQDIPLLIDLKQHFFISHIIGPTDLLHPSPAPHFKTFQLFLIYYPKRPFNMGRIDCSETSVMNYLSTLHNNPDEHISHKFRNIQILLFEVSISNSLFNIAVPNSHHTTPKRGKPLISNWKGCEWKRPLTDIRQACYTALQLPGKSEETQVKS